MIYQNYLHVNVPDKSFAKFNKRIEDYDLKSVRGFFKSEALLDKLLKTPMAAFLNAPVAKGSFPLVVFSVGQNDHTLDQNIQHIAILIYCSPKVMETSVDLQKQFVKVPPVAGARRLVAQAISVSLTET